VNAVWFPGAMRHSTLIATAALLVVAAAACGGDDDGGGGAEAVVGGDDGTAIVGDPPAVPADDGSEARDAPDAPEAPAGAPPPDAPEVSMPDLPTVNDGTCSVNVTGDEETSWTGGGTVGDYIISYWFDDTDRELFGDDFAILLNCVSGADMLTIMTRPHADATSVPMAPASYELRSQREDGLFTMLVTLAASNSSWSIDDAGGTLEFTRFDQDRLVGRFEVAMRDPYAQYSEGGEEASVVITGEFDFPSS
jgi:hypothetical protein